MVIAPGRCDLPSDPEILLAGDGAELVRWTLPEEATYFTPALDSELVYDGYRDYLVALPVDVSWVPGTETGVIEPITCLDAGLFAWHNQRVDQRTTQTEFLASVLRRDGRLTILLGAGSEMFPPKAVYGLVEVAEFQADGWEYVYAIHNHTLDDRSGTMRLGTPGLSEPDAELSLSLAANRALQEARVTNGFFTFRITGAELLERRAP